MKNKEASEEAMKIKTEQFKQKLVSEWEEKL